MVHRARTVGFAILLCVAATFLASVHAHEHHSNTTGQQGWLFSSKNPFSVPITINVGLVGLNGDGYKQYHMDSEAFNRALSNAIESYTPSCVETQEALHLKYDITYRVMHIEAAAAANLEKALQTAMQFKSMRSADAFIYEVEVLDVEKEIDVIYDSLFSSDDGADAKDHTILLLSPDKERMVPPPGPDGVSPKSFSYRYRYDGGTPTMTWIAQRRYIAVDLSAGPCEFGVTNAGEGTVSVDSVPSLDDMEEEEQQAARQRKVPDAQDGDEAEAVDTDGDTKKTERELSTHMRFLSQLSSLVLSAVQYVFLPDIKHSSVEFAEKVVVPIVVLRNHRRFNPLLETRSDYIAGANPISEFTIDVPLIRSEIKRMLLPHQELLLTTAVYELHDHKHISMAVFKALKGDSIHTATPSGHYVTKTASYLDSSVLLDEMKNAYDLVVQGLLHSPSVAHSDLQGRGGERVGHRILPVYVFSLLGLPPDVMLDRTHLSVPTKDAVLVLQTGGEPVFVPYFNEEGIIHVSPRAPTRHIIAGVATALSGLMPPYERFDRRNKMIVSDYMWGTGRHPFGPFTRSPHMSDTFLHNLRLNCILSRVNEAYLMVRDATHQLDAFTTQFVFDPFGDSIVYMQKSDNVLEFAPLKSLFSLSDRERHDPSVTKKTPFAQSVVERLFDEVLQLERHFNRLAQLLHEHALKDADQLSGSIHVNAKAFVVYAQEEMMLARRQLMCCSKVHLVSHKRESVVKAYAYYAVVGIGGIAVFAWVISKVSRSASSSRQPSTTLPMWYAPDRPHQY